MKQTHCCSNKKRAQKFYRSEFGCISTSSKPKKATNVNETVEEEEDDDDDETKVLKIRPDIEPDKVLVQRFNGSIGI